MKLILAAFKSETGTIHHLDSEKQILHLAAQVGLPPFMLDVVKTIPGRKGIAGETGVRNGPVTMCNLQTDTSGGGAPASRHVPAIKSSARHAPRNTLRKRRKRRKKSGGGWVENWFNRT